MYFIFIIHLSFGKPTFNKHGWMYKYLCSMSDFFGYILRHIIAELCGISTFGFWRESSFDFLKGYKIQPPLPSPAQVVS